MEQPSGGDQKIQEYVDRIKNGEPKESIMQGLSPSFIEAIERKLSLKQERENITSSEEDNLPAQYEGLDSETLDFVWVIPEYVDPAKTATERERKEKALAAVREKEQAAAKKEERARTDSEDAEAIRKELNISQMKQPESEARDAFSEFRMKNGETDEGFFWNEYRNKAAKDLKESGQFEWGKERIYFDIPIAECEALRDLAFTIASEEKIPLAFKYLDEKKTFPVHKDGTETRFVMNFASADDARAFYRALSEHPKYKQLTSDRQVDYKGIRIDALAEYASGFREKRGALERIISATLNSAGMYEYTSESGKTIAISPEQFSMFTAEYEKLKEALEKEKALWGGSESGASN